MASTIRRSQNDFGKRARDRYRRLLDQTLRDAREDPRRIGARTIDDIREGYFVYHLRCSARKLPKPTVRQPRHLIAFTVDDSGDIIVARVFHERRMLGWHLGDDDDQ